MKKLLIAAILLFAIPVRAAPIHFGAGQVAGTFAAAFAAGGDGDDYYFHGPVTENSVTVTWAKNNATLQPGNASDYILDGQLATGNGFMVTGTGNTMDLNSQLKIEGYGTYPLKVDGASNVISDLYMYDNGYNAAGNCYDIYLNANSDLISPVIASGLDNGTRHYGYYLDNCPTGSVTDAVVQNITVTGGGTRVYGLIFLANNGGVIVNGLMMDSLSAGANMYGVYWLGTNADDVGILRNATVKDISGATLATGFYAPDRGMDVQNFVIDTVTGNNEIGIHSVTAAFAGGTNAVMNGTVYDTVDGFFCDNDFAGSGMTASNIIVTDCSSEGFKDSGTIAPTSSYNLAYNNGTDYSGWTPGTGDLTAVNPLFTDPANEDFTLQSTSPCIDTGLWITGRTSDIAGQPISGNGQDRGAYEFQQIGGRNRRTEISQPPIIQTRSQRSLR